MRPNPTGFSPSSISNMVLWLDANDPTSYTYTTAPIISTMHDKSGCNNIAISYPGQEPSYSSNLNAVYFSTQYMTLPNNTLPTGDSSYTYFVVFNMLENFTAGGLIGGGNTATNEAMNLRGSGTNSIHEYWWFNDIDPTNTYSFGQTSIVETWYTSAANRTITLNYAGSNTDTPGTRSQQNYNNAVGRTIASEYMTGLINEILVYSNVLSESNRQTVEGYLAWKWGITSYLPSNHPYKNLPFIPTVEATPRLIPNFTTLLSVNTYSTIKTFTMPTVSTNPGRLLIIKDSLGYAGFNNIYLSTIGLDRIDSPYASSLTLANSFGAWTFTNDSITNWIVLDAYTGTFPIITNPPSTLSFTPDFLGYIGQFNYAGNASYYSASNWLYITPNTTAQAGSAFYYQKVNINHFTFSANIRFDYTQADGGTFCIQTAASTIVGGSGGYLGYTGITSSFAITLKTYCGIVSPNAGVFSTEAISSGQTPADLGGSGDLTGALGFSPASTYNILLTINYNNPNFSYMITNTDTGSNYTSNGTVNIPSLIGSANAYIGFTGGTGGGGEDQYIQSFTFTSYPY